MFDIVKVLLLFILPLTCADAENITAVVGENVTMTCKVLNNNNPVTLVDWTRLTRPDLDPDQVLLYRSNKFYPDLQHPSFQNRVDLQDLQKGDVSLILRNLTMNDSGTYQCDVVQNRTNHHKRDVDLINTINLSVIPSVVPSVVPSGTYWTVALVVTVVLVVLVVLAAVVFLIIKRRKKNSSRRPDEPADVEMNPLNHSDSSKPPETS